MQTLRKRTSPCKYKNDPSRFLGEGITFKAKLIGILEVSEARGDKMCQDALNDLKTAIRAAGEHKQRITISISIDGLRLRDEKTGDCLYHHPVHKISFIAQDMSDSRAFGYIFGSPDTGHRFFGIKTDKTASQVVISMRDLFQVVFELKKKEIEMAKHHSEQHHGKYGSTGYMDSINFSKDESEQDKGKGKYSQLLKSRCLTSKPGESGPSDFKGSTSEAIADLLDLEHELNSIQQGINQMEKITPSDPFGPLSKGEPYVDPFDDSFSKMEKLPEEKISTSVEKSLKSQTSRLTDTPPDQEKHSSFFGSTASTSKTHFFSQFSPGIGKSKTDDSRWFDQETESLFNDTVSINNAEPTSSPVALNTPAPAPETEQADGKKSPVKTDLFTELDPLGTGRVKPYVDKKDFFQELKNPPKKVLKEMITEPATTEASSFYFPANFKDEKSRSVPKSDSVLSSQALDTVQGFKNGSTKYAKIDPFYDGDPFEKTDPFQEDFSTSIGFPPVFSAKASSDGVFDDKMFWKLEKGLTKDSKEEKPTKNSPTNLSLFSSSTLRVSLPPEKTDGPLSISTITSKLKSPDSPEDSKTVRRKCYQSLKQSTVEGSEESPIHEEPFVSTKLPNLGSKSETGRRSPFKDKFYSVHSPPCSRSDKENSKVYSSVEILDAVTPDPPPRAKTALFSIKPPPLPPKKLNQTQFKPPARPPSLEETMSHYDYLEKKETCNGFQLKEEVKCMKLKKQLFTGKDSPPLTCELKKQNSESSFPVLPPPPQRKGSSDVSKTLSGRKSKSPSGTPGSILNLKLNQLDSSGLENLAVTLGIPSENIYSMTLQELTKMLSEKYLTSTESKTEELVNESFEADFDANFGKPDTNNTNPPPSYDKYAVFKELIESENKTSDLNSNTETIKKEEEELPVQEVNGQEDKYAALRQLSLNATKSGNFSEEDDNGIKATSCGFNDPLEDSSSAINNLDLVAGIPNIRPSRQVQSLESRTESAENPTVPEKTAELKPEVNAEQKDLKEGHFSGDTQLFPLVDQFSDEKKPNSPRDNWATFEKSDYEDIARKKSAENFNDNENSPFSSDGKEEVKEIPFHWHQNTFRRKTRKDVPWQDDDESWDDYSPKESYCSDESSHEERSPEVGREDRYEKPWNVCGRPPKSERMWNDKSGQWNRRDKWQEETEDEFEDSWRKQRDRTGSYETDRKNNFWHNNYEGYNKRFEWCNSRSEPWDENERHVHCYGSRRKRSESDNEYRKRCDSDASDKECVWTFQKGYSDSHGRSGKQKQYHGGPGHSFRDCQEYCHESRSKHRKNVSQKRPSSASESKRNYEKMFPGGEYPHRNFDKTYPGKREPEKDEYSRYQYGTCKDSRHRGDMEFSHYYSSYDRKIPSHHSKLGSRTSRGSTSAQSEMFPSPNKRGEAVEGKNHEFGYFDSFGEKHHKFGKPDSHFTFDSEAENQEKSKKVAPEQSPQDFPKSPDRRVNQWASANGKPNGDGFYATSNTSENFANFTEDFKTSPKKLKENGKPETPHFETGRPQVKSKNLAMLSRQESSATLRKSDSINIFSRDKDPFEGDDFFSNDS